MMMGCGKSFAKNALFYLNVVYGLVGLIVEGIGFALLVKWITTTAEHDSIGISWLFYIMAGVVMCLAALFVCYGAARESNGMLTAYAVFIITVFLLQLAVAVWFSVYSCIVEEIFKGIFESMFKEENSTSFHRIEPKDCKISPLEALTGLIAYSLCSTFNDGACVAKQDGVFEKWYTSIILLTIGVPLVEIASACVALYLAIYLTTTRRRSYAAVPVVKDNEISVTKPISIC